MQGYDDFLNNVFKDKSHEAVERQMRASRRAEFIHNKFRDTWVEASAEKPDRRIRKQIEKFIELKSDEIEQRELKRKELEAELNNIDEVY